MQLHFPRELSPEQFLLLHWQQRPLLMPAALPRYRCPLEPEALAGLACAPEIESRIVLEQGGDGPWQVLQGPFEAETFTTLPPSHWTLLVQDVDKHVPAVAELLELFRFIPDWRLDDIMISYATDQGSVGPHTDDYDVFLIQAQGRRRWQIHTRPVSEQEYIPDLELRILPEFEAEQAWLLEPGDILYLPPNVAHWGVAEGDGCITCSVGFRSPALRELAAAWCDELTWLQTPEGRYRDQPLAPQSHPGEIIPAALERVGALLDRSLYANPARQSRWFGRFITEPKPDLEVAARDIPLAEDELLQQLQRQGALVRNGCSRLAFIRGSGAEDYLFVNGEEFPLARQWVVLLELLTDQQRLDHTALKPWLVSAECRRLLTHLYNLNHLQFPDE